jgi:hypothetical protein
MDIATWLHDLGLSEGHQLRARPRGEACRWFDKGYANGRFREFCATNLRVEVPSQPSQGSPTRSLRPVCRQLSYGGSTNS